MHSNLAPSSCSPGGYLQLPRATTAKGPKMSIQMFLLFITSTPLPLLSDTK